MFKKYILLLFVIFLLSCTEDEIDGEKYKGPREIVMIDKGIYKVSYNEIFLLHKVFGLVVYVIP